MTEERFEGSFDPGQQDLLGPHDGGDGGHGRSNVSPAVAFPVLPGVGDGIAGERASHRAS